MHGTTIIIIIISAQEGAEKHVMTKEGVKLQSVLKFLLFIHHY